MRAKLFITGLFTLSVIASPSWSAEELQAPPRAECNKVTRGQFWPIDVNHNQALLQKAAAAGSLWQCEASRWSYKWKSLTIAIPKQHAKPQLASSVDLKDDRGQ